MPDNFNLKRIESQFKAVLQQAPAELGNDAVNFFLDRFKYQNWLGNTTEFWKSRKAVSKWGKLTPRNKGRAILIDSSRLRRGIRITRIANLTATIGNDVPYAKAHNEGFRGKVKQTVRQHERKKTKLGIVSKTQLKKSSKISFGRMDTGGRTVVKSHTRTINQNIPRRQFMGYSPVLKKQLERRLLAELMKGLR